MWDALRANDPGDEVLAAYIVKEMKLRVLLALAHCQPDRHRLRNQLYRFYDLCAEVNMPEVTKLAATIETWRPGIAAFIDTGITKARAEGYNRLVKQVKRSACGFRNLENPRRRIRFHCTRKQRASIQIRCGDDRTTRRAGMTGTLAAQQGQRSPCIAWRRHWS